MTDRILRLLTGRPWLTGALLLVLAGGAAWFAQDFRLDASADSLILENDADLKRYRAISREYGSDEFLVVTVTPEGDLFGQDAIDRVAALRDELKALEGVKGVTSYLDVPLIESPPMTLGEITDGARTLTHPETDRELARKEFATSPLYRQLLTSPDGQTTALLVTLEGDAEATRLLRRREDLRQKQLDGSLSAAEAAELERVSRDYQRISGQRQAQTQDLVARVRAVMDGYREGAILHLGGLPMIASDMIDFVRADIRLFSVLVGAFLVLLLALAFRQLRWVLIPVAICGAVSLAMVGWLGLMHWPVTVVSSNFTSLTLIITLSLVVHLVVRYRELQAQGGNDQGQLVRETLRSKFAPSFYTAATTIVSFGSLIIADIRPVIDFGLMMVWAVVFAFVLTFLMFPWLLARLAPRGAGAEDTDAANRVTQNLGGAVQSRGVLLLVVFAVLTALAAIGITRLGVENRFIDYFDKDTEIYQGMVLIDKQLGGTTPLDVVIDAPQSFFEEQAAAADDDFAEFMDEDAGLSGSSYWYNVFALEKVRAIHEYLDGLPETGKVLSMASTMDFIRILNGNEALDNFTLSVMHNRLPEEIKAQLFEPYMSEDGNQVHFAVRVIDSDKNLNRNALLQKIRRDLLEKFELNPEQLTLTGALVLYNNVLQSLFDSQIKTLSAVFAAIVLMLWMLFGSLRVALIGVQPTLFAALMILGLMGWLGIPLDIMTITIAAIVIGIGVDNTIHYTHRFQDEIRHGAERWAAMRATHGSVGRAIFLTSVIVTLGFSILGLSNFVPITYFGLFTGLAMLLALIANLTLLPLLLVKLGPKAT